MIRVMVVDDAPVVRTVLKRMLTKTGEIEVTAMAANGAQALELLDRADPHVILTDLSMPVMDGLKFVEEVMERKPTPILVVSAAVDKNPTNENTFKLLAAGAIDVIPKPRGGLDEAKEEISKSLIAKIKILKGVVPIRRRRAKGQFPVKPKEPAYDSGSVKSPPKIVAVGASTGGPVTLRSIFYRLPPNYPIPIVCIQHISKGFSGEMVSWFKTQIRMNVQIARDKTKPNPGTIYFPPEDRHLTFDSEGCFRTDAGSPTDLHRPSVDTTFISIAKTFGNRSVGILLTGMGKDGAAGLAAINSGGGFTIAQEETSCVVFGMPGEAIRLGAAQKILPPERIYFILESMIPSL